MASRFSTLPDIDTDSVDVYETSSPELKPSKSVTGRRTADDGDEDDSDLSGEERAGVGASSRNQKKGKNGLEENDGTASIDKQGLPADEAMRRFQGSTEATPGESSKSRYRRRQRPQDHLDSDVYEVDFTPSRAPEAPLARLRRLRLEATELEEELSLQSSSNNRKDQSDEKKRAEPTPEVLLQQLRALRTDLTNLRIDPDDPAGLQSDKIREARTLLQTLKQPDQAKGVDERLQADAAPAATTRSTPSELVGLEARLTSLEALVGTNQGVLEETQALPRPLLPTLARLEHLSTVLSQPRHLDAISKRIKVLVSELDRVYESRRKIANLSATSSSTVAALLDRGPDAQANGGAPSSATVTPLDPISLSKLDDLFALSSRLQPLLPLAPALLARLRSLATLHSHASQFSSSLSSLEAAQGNFETEHEELEKAVKGLEESMKANEERMTGNLEVVMQRMENLEQRVKAL